MIKFITSQRSLSFTLWCFVVTALSSRLIVSPLAYAVPVNVAWDAPTTLTDGAPYPREIQKNYKLYTATGAATYNGGESISLSSCATPVGAPAVCPGTTVDVNPAVGTVSFKVSALRVDASGAPAGVEGQISGELKMHALRVSKTGAGAGTVEGNGINCGATCDKFFTKGRAVTLVATPLPGSLFSGWSGACVGTGSCVVTVDSAKSVAANFTIAQVALTTTKSGDGAGTINGTLAGVSVINCGVGAGCSKTVNMNSEVVLSAVAAPGSLFTGWKGVPCPGVGSCTVKLDSAKSVNAEFVAAQYSLTALKAGAGNGTINGKLAGATVITCGSGGTLCAKKSTLNSLITLTAEPVAGSTFVGWSGACSGVGACAVTLTAAKSVTATFELAKYPLTVTKNGDGTGTVSGTFSNGGGAINCGATCSGNVTVNSTINLTAAAAPGSTFNGWGGACGGTGVCAVTMSNAKTVVATFTPNKQTVTVVKTGSGTVNATANGAPIMSCGATCSAQVTQGATVTLTAVPSANFSFTGWNGGGCSGSGLSCTTTVNSMTQVTAVFAAAGKFYLALEAEQAALVSGVIPLAESKASGGSAVVSTIPNVGGASFKFQAPSSGTYYIWARMIAASENSNSFFVSMDGGVADIFDMRGPFGVSPEWEWDAVNGRKISETAEMVVPRKFDLLAGEHTVAFKAREPNAMLDAILITNDPLFIPGGKDATLLTLSVGVGVAGKGEVTAPGIKCQGATGDCLERFTLGTVITLQAKPASGQSFAQWTGVCKVASPICTIIMMANSPANAHFTVQMPPAAPANIRAVDVGP